MNNKALIVLVLVVVLFGGGYLLMQKSQSTSPQPTSTSEVKTVNQEGGLAKNTVERKGFAVSPSSLTVKVGDTVTWTNSDAAGHSATADDKSFDTGVFAQGENESVSLNQAGTFTYHCVAHPNMKGTIVVEP